MLGQNQLPVRQTMQSKSKTLNDFSNLMTNAVGAVKGVGDEVKAIGRAQAERMITDMDLITREEFDVLKAMINAQREEINTLKDRLAALEK